MVDGNEGEKLKKIICVDGKIQVLIKKGDRDADKWYEYFYGSICGAY